MEKDDMEKQDIEKQDIEKQDIEKDDTEKQDVTKKRWFGRGIYGSKDVPIRLLDGLIGVVTAIIIGMIVFFAVKGGFWITFDSQGGSAVEKQKVKHGEFITEPETPVKPGFVFEGWEDEKQELEWDFENFAVEEDMTLTAKWSPAEILVRFDLNGGTLSGKTEAEGKTVVFEETYGELPVPEKEGSTFAGWYYSGNEITEDTQVLTNGEHILTAEWK